MLLRDPRFTAVAEEVAVALSKNADDARPGHEESCSTSLFTL